MDKTSKTYWKGRIFKRSFTRANGEKYESGEWYAEMQIHGKRKKLPLGSGNKSIASSNAARLFKKIRMEGWQSMEMNANGAGVAAGAGGRAGKAKGARPISCGDLLKVAARRKDVAAQSMTFYGQCLRRVVSGITGVPMLQGGTHRAELREAATALLNDQPLEVLSATSFEQWRAEFVALHDDPEGKRSAKRTTNSYLRALRSLLDADVCEEMGIVSPMEGVKLLRVASADRYVSRFDLAELVAAAKAELGCKRQPNENLERYARRMEAFKALMLVVMTGARKGEVDKMLWCNIRLDEAEVVFQGELKNRASEDVVALSETSVELLRSIRQAFPDDKFFIRGKRKKGYRCALPFHVLIDWLRAWKNKNNNFPFKCIQKPLHQIRKEAGAVITSQFGIYAASRFLRHASVKTTEMHYADEKRDITIDF